MSASEGKLATGTYMLRKLASAPLINSHSLGINLLINGLGIDQLTEIPSPCMPSYSIAIDGSTCARARSLYTNPNAPRSPHIPCSPYH